MPARKKATEEGAATTSAEPERRSTRIKEMPAKPAAPAPTAAAAAKPKKAVKKTDAELAEWKPTKKPAAKKRKKADVEKEEEAGGAEEAKEEDKPKKKAKTEPKPKSAPAGEAKPAPASKAKKAAPKSEKTTKAAETKEAKEAATATRTERRKSGVVTVQPTIEEGSEDKPDGDAMIVGSILPQMVLKNEKGEDVEIATITHDSGVVIFAAPKADTPGCNKQACHFRDSTPELKKLGYTVYALTADSPAALTKWQAKNTLGYSLLSDPERKFIKLLGAKNGNSTKRSHFVFEKGTGKLLDAKIGVKPDDSHAAALKFVQSL